ncbi:VOC family protein [Aliiroseovarius sp.]|uniref:VOC family protein n=1 Tax=Aliiroseovarius sp. TaxID=1872442 RepID=UPI003BAD9ABF
MDYETVSAADFGRALKGLGVNILTRDVKAKVAFLTEVFAMQAHRVTADFAILIYGDGVFQIHADHTYHSHPLPALLPEAGARGAGVELRLYDTDPDQAAARAEAFGATLLQAPEDKPHGLRECVILDEEGYAWLPSRPLSPDEEV